MDPQVMAYSENKKMCLSALSSNDDTAAQYPRCLSAFLVAKRKSQRH